MSEIMVDTVSVEALSGHLARTSFDLSARPALPSSGHQGLDVALDRLLTTLVGALGSADRAVADRSALTARAALLYMESDTITGAGERRP